MNQALLYTATVFMIITVGLIVIIMPTQIERLKTQTDSILENTERLKNYVLSVESNRKVLRKLKRNYFKSFVTFIRHLVHV